MNGTDYESERMAIDRNWRVNVGKWYIGTKRPRYFGKVKRLFPYEVGDKTRPIRGYYGMAITRAFKSANDIGGCGETRLTDSL